MELNFQDFKLAVQRQFNKMKEGTIYCANTEKDFLWDLYLDSFPEGTNPTFRERREYDCCACRSFVRNAGRMVAIVDNKLVSIWDIDIDGPYKVVASVLADYIKSRKIENVFLSTENHIGVDKNREDLETSIRTWEHFHVVLPSSMVLGGAAIGPKLNEYRGNYDVMIRSLKEITPDAIETVQDLISQNSLYRGVEKIALVNAFALLKKDFDKLHSNIAQELFAWSQVKGPNSFVCRIRNDVVGTLLVDLSSGVDLETAVKSFEDKVSGTNYKRPTSLVTPKMRDTAKQTIIELGLMPSLDRRYARLEDVNVTDVLFANRSAKTRMAGDVWDDLPVKAANPKSLDKVEEIPIEKFISDILPTATSVEALFENKHAGNLVSLIAPYDLTAKTMFKWDNPFSWTYNGDVADSIKERVKQAGGNVTGDVCCRLAWFNTDDLDFHMKEPRFHIYYGSKKSPSTGGQLDVDMNVTNPVRNPVENIFYSSAHKMSLGKYLLSVNQFCKRETKDMGFEVEIDVLGTVHSFAYDKGIPQNNTIDVAVLNVTATGVVVEPLLPATQASKVVWNISTQDFHPVTVVTLSPNYWNGRGSGNKHYFFMLDGCKNDGSARGFYNEFLSSELEPHRKTMELVGSKMRTEESDDQLSGLGFSSTQRNSLVVKVHGSFTRMLKIMF